MVGFYRPLRSPKFPNARVEVLGVFGSGKTTLVDALRGAFHPLKETHEAIPFWKDNELHRTLGYLPYDVAFLMHHLEQVVFSKSSKLLVCDWSFKTDLLWASMRLEDQFYAYQRLHRSLTNRLQEPIGYLYLKYPPELIQERMALRGREQEKHIDVRQIKKAISALEILVQGLSKPVFELNPDTTAAFVAEKISTWERGLD